MNPGNAKGQGQGPGKGEGRGPAPGGEQRQHGSEPQALTNAATLAYLAAVHGLLDWAPERVVPRRHDIKAGKVRR